MYFGAPVCASGSSYKKKNGQRSIKKRVVSDTLFLLQRAIYRLDCVAVRYVYIEPCQDRGNDYRMMAVNSWCGAPARNVARLFWDGATGERVGNDCIVFGNGCRAIFVQLDET